MPSLLIWPGPRTYSRKPCRRDSGYITPDLAHRWRWILSASPEVERSQALQERHRTALGYSCVPISHHVFAQPILVRLVTEERQRNSRIAPNIPDFLVK